METQYPYGQLESNKFGICFHLMRPSIQVVYVPCNLCNAHLIINEFNLCKCYVLINK